MNILSVFVLFAILLKCVVASWRSLLKVEFERAVDGRSLDWLESSRSRWYERNDLFDSVIEKGTGVTIWFIQSVKGAKPGALAALFDKGDKEMIDNVLENVSYNDGDLVYSTLPRTKLAGSPEKFLRILDRINDPKNQEKAVEYGVRGLFVDEKYEYDSIVPLVNAFVNALEKGTFKSKRLKEQAIQGAFRVGAQNNNLNIVKLYYEHPAITEEEYANGLRLSWELDGQAFQFLLGHADQGDLNAAKKQYAEKWDEKFRQALDEAPKPVPPAGSRLRRSLKKAVLKMLAPTTEPSVLDKLDNIIEEYLLEGEEGTKKDESEGQEAGTENRTD